MLVRLNPKQNATTVLSIPRDLRVTIPGHGIDKINAAYGEGGLDLTTRTVKQLLSTPGHRFRVNHAIAINFKGFRDAVDIVHCVYIDVDRRYYHSNLGVPIGQRYAEIDVQPGYQRLCGQQALDYVRFRHLDNDIVRAARQQDFLRQASAQLSTSSLLRNLNPLVKAFAKATSSDSNLQTSRGILRLLRLAASSTGRPVRQVRFPHTFVQSAPPPRCRPRSARSRERRGPDRPGRLCDGDPRPDPAGGPRVHASAAGAPSHAPVKAKKRGGKRRARVSAASYGLVKGLSAAKAIVRPAIARRHFKLPFYAPAWLTRRGRYPRARAWRARRGCMRSPTVAATAIRPTGSSSRRTRRRGSTTASRARAGSVRRSSTAHTRPNGWPAAPTRLPRRPAYPPRRLAHAPTAPTGCRTPSAATSPTAPMLGIARSLTRITAG